MANEQYVLASSATCPTDRQRVEIRQTWVMVDASTLRRIAELYEDAQRCAEVAGLTYIRDDEPGIRRRRRGHGFSYLDPSDRAVQDAASKQRILALAVPPAWKNV
ncbi:MAG: hypothetical protein ABJB98_11175, partial [Actinomycetota bacterium]